MNVFERYKRGILLFTFLLSISLYGQNGNYDEFYKSSFKPKELNGYSADRIDNLFDYYSRRYKKKGLKKKKEYEDFVYRSNYFLENLNKSGQVFYNDAISKYLNNLKDFLLADNRNKNRITVYLTRFPTANAFANDFGNIYINVATIATLDNEEELLTVLAHEISHVLLKHSHKFEEYKKGIDKGKLKGEEFSVLQKYSFSKSQEYKADKEGLKLLQDKKIGLLSAHQIYTKFEYTLDPIESGDIDIAMLFENDAFGLNDFQAKMSDLDTLYYATGKKKVEDEFSTHPPLKERQEKIWNFITDNPEDTISEYKKIGDFSYYKELAKKVLLQSYIEKGWYVKGLHLALMLRSKDPNNEYLIRSQAKLLCLLAQQKYNETPFSRFLNDDGDAYRDTSFIKFKQTLLSYNALDFNILAFSAVKKMYQKYSDPYLEVPYEFITNLIYKYHATLFTKGGDGPKFIASNNLDSNIVRYNDMSALANLTDDEQKHFEKLTEKEGLVFIPIAERDTNYTIVRHFLDANTFSEKELQFIERYKQNRDNYEKTLTFDTYNFTLNPDKAIELYVEGEYNKAIDFNPSLKTALVQSNSFFLKKKRGDYVVDHKRSLSLEKDIHRIIDTLSSVSVNYSNANIQGCNVTDVNKHYYLLNWVIERFQFNDLIYSGVDEQVADFVESENVRYLLYNFNVVGRKFGFFKWNYKSMTYNVYFDLENEGVAFVGKVASSLKPNKYMWKQLYFMTDQFMHAN